MRSVLIIVVVFVSSSSWAQNWRDSLSAAHSAYSEGKFKEAHAKFISAQRLAPEGIDLSKDIGTAAYRKGDYASAEKAFYSAANKSETADERARKWHNIGNAQMKQKNYQSAMDSYKQALRENPKDDKTRYNLAEAKNNKKNSRSKRIIKINKTIKIIRINKIRITRINKIKISKTHPTKTIKIIHLINRVNKTKIKMDKVVNLLLQKHKNYRVRKQNACSMS